ncbi:MAG: hypothetical protein M3R00_04225 [Pseudomonadota bacterium]|nr:hypothetical protein [Pseudomonadota bacterium]
MRKKKAAFVDQPAVIAAEPDSPSVSAVSPQKDRPPRIKSDLERLEALGSILKDIELIQGNNSDVAEDMRRVVDSRLASLSAESSVFKLKIEVCSELWLN